MENIISTQRNWWDSFSYDESSPSFLRWNNGAIAGTKFGNYYRVKLNKIGILVHRIIFEMMTGQYLGDNVIDHKDGNGTNNIITNLRSSTYRMNNQNRKKPDNNSSGKMGVSILKYPQGFIYVATHAENGESKRKFFRSWVHGDEEAFILACKWRDKQIEKLNKIGETYSDTHGRQGERNEFV